MSDVEHNKAVEGEPTSTEGLETALESLERHRAKSFGARFMKDYQNKKQTENVAINKKSKRVQRQTSFDASIHTSSTGKKKE
jgi:hypothetical protein